MGLRLVMTNKELQEELKKHPDDLNIYINDEAIEYNAYCIQRIRSDHSQIDIIIKLLGF